jgi:hypothetical protein
MCVSSAYSQSLQGSYYNQQNDAASRRELCYKKLDYYKSIGYTTPTNPLFVKEGKIYSFDSYKCEYNPQESPFTYKGTLNEQRQVNMGDYGLSSIVEWKIENGEICEYEKYISNMDYGIQRRCWGK